MKLKDKIKSYSFWVSLASAVILILKILGTRFGFTVDETMVSDLFTALCSVLVLLGIIVVPTSAVHSNTNTSSIQEQNNNLLTPNNNIDSTIEQNSNKEVILEDNSNDSIITTESIENTIQPSIQNPNEESFETTTHIEINSESIINDTNDSFVSENICDVENNSNQAFSNDSKIVEDFSEESNKDNSYTIEQTIFKSSSLKELLTSEREKFSNNINEYILELQEEIRKAREQM